MDAEDQHQHQHQGAGSKAPARHNHAIWDQIGLIHWLRHNVASFNGDPNNITLASADNKAAQWVQLLSMSPLAKGELELELGNGRVGENRQYWPLGTN